MSTLTVKLQEIMDLQGVTQEDLAARAGLSQGYLSQLCIGRTTPNVITAVHIAHALGMRVEDIWIVGY